MPRESLRSKRERMADAIARLKATYPDSRCSLDYETPFQLLIATILSAQCTDERVNEVTPRLFARWPDPGAMAEAPLEAIEEVVRPTGFFRNKAKHLQGAARLLVTEYNGEVPPLMDELMRLPGVARKTANVVLHTALGTPAGAGAGVCVDTHVTRLANRMRFVSTQNPVKIERELQKVVAESDWGIVTHLLIDHGRAVCTARTTPYCDRCVMSDLCPSAFKV